MKQKNSFEYIYSKKRTTIVEFDIKSDNGKSSATNIQLKSNWRDHYPKNPTIAINSNGEYGFYENGVLITNGDIQQIIKRINSIIEISQTQKE